METPHWLTEYTLVSDADGRIETIVLLVPHKKNGRDRIQIKPVLNELNAPDRLIIKLYNEIFGQLQDGNRPNSKVPGEPVKEITKKNSPEKTTGTDWENQPRTFDHRKTNHYKDEGTDDGAIFSAGETQDQNSGNWEDTVRGFLELKSKISGSIFEEHYRADIQKLNQGLLKDEYQTWIQDPVLCYQKLPPVLGKGYDVKETTLMFPIFQENIMEFLVALELPLEKSLNIRSHPSHLYFQGGNMLFIEDTLFIGRELLEQNVELLNAHDSIREGKIIRNWNAESVLEEFRDQLHVKHVVSLGAKEPFLSLDTTGNLKEGKPERKELFQPAYHIDLFLNFGGRDPETGKRIAFLGSPQKGLDVLRKHGMPYPYEGDTWKDDEIQTERMIQEVTPAFQTIRKQLEQTGLKVIEIPLYIFWDRLIKRYVYCSYNNCLVEVYNQEKIKHLFLPSYVTADGKSSPLHNERLKILEEVVIQLYNDLGYGVTPIKAGRFFLDAAQRAGSLRCMTKVLRRSLD